MATNNAINVGVVAGGGNTYTFPTSTTTLLGSVDIGSTVQAQGAVLDDLNTLGAAASDGQFIVATGAGAFAYESGATARTSLGLGTANSPQFSTIELGAATDTTLSRASAGQLAVEGVTVATSSNTLTFTNKTLTNPVIDQVNTSASTSHKINAGYYGPLTADTDGATITFDLSASNIHTVTLGGNRTLALSNATTGQVFMLRLLQDATGSRTVTWFSTIKWAGGTAPTLTTTASKADMLGFVCTGTGTYDGFVIGQNI